jgi:uncharacterized MAPEG superfamily protein
MTKEERAMTPEMKYLAYITVLTSLMWIPYVLNVIARNRLSDAVGYPDTPLQMAPWAERLKKAHYNAIENLMIFAVLILIANAMDLSNAATTSAAAFYFWARVVHIVAYGAGIPWVRTLAFAVAWLSILCIAWQVLLLTHM